MVLRGLEGGASHKAAESLLRGGWALKLSSLIDIPSGSNGSAVFKRCFLFFFW